MTRRWLTRTAAWCGLFAAIAAASAEAAERLPIPTVAGQRISAQRVREIFRDDFTAARTPKQQANLADALIGHSRDTSDASDAFALLQIARNLATEAGDVAVAKRAISELESRYQVPPGTLQVETLREMGLASSGPGLGTVIDGLIGVAAEAADRGDMAEAEDLLKAAAAAARKARDKQRQDVVLDELKRVKEQAKATEKIAPLLKRLEADSEDREAATLLGKHRCFVEGDWAAGLPLLARGDDAALSRLAVAELRPADDLVALGDSWWTYAESAKGTDRSPAAAHAIGHYRAALDKLTGLEKVRIEKRIAAAEQELATRPATGTAARPPHAAFWLDATAPGAVFNLDGKPITRARAGAAEAIGAWKDVSNRALLAAPENPASAPSLVAGAIGGNPALAFTGKQFLVAKGPLPEVGALFLVAQPATPAVDGCILGSAEGAMVDAWTRADGALWFTMHPRRGDMRRLNTSSNSCRAGKPFLLTVCWSKPFALRVNGQPKVASQDIPPDVLGADEFVIGASDRQARYPFSGFLGEVLVLDRVPAEPDLAKLEAHFMQKWRISP